MSDPTRTALLTPSQGAHTPAERLSRKYQVDSTGCWLWTAGLASNGYGHMSIKQRYHQATRLMYILHVGPIPEGRHLDHLCRIPRCVNPAHLEPVTCAENIRRGRGTRLNPEAVETIRAMRRRGISVRAIGLAFGINHGHVSRISRGHAWRSSDAAVAVA